MTLESEGFIHAVMPKLHDILAKTIIGISLAVFSLATILGPGMQTDPFYNYYYLFAWWPFILAGEAALYFRGRSLLFAQPARFLLLLPLSVCIWLVFECFNFRLQNWHYLNVPPSLPLRWTVYSFSFATILPALGMVKAFLEELGADKNIPEKKVDLRDKNEMLQISGAFFLFLSLATPSYFFPLVWVGFIFLIDPFLYRRGQPCFILNLAIGRWREFFLWMYSGLICGFLWEMWNYQAGSKWIYTIPFIGDIKLFEMPLPGFLGFPFFALECTLLAMLFFFLQEKIGLLKRKKKIPIVLGVAVTVVLYCATVFHFIDVFTVI